MRLPHQSPLFLLQRPPFAPCERRLRSFSLSPPGPSASHTAPEPIELRETISLGQGELPPPRRSHIPSTGYVQVIRSLVSSLTRRTRTLFRGLIPGYESKNGNEATSNRAWATRRIHGGAATTARAGRPAPRRARRPVRSPRAGRRPRSRLRRRPSRAQPWRARSP